MTLSTSWTAPGYGSTVAELCRAASHEIPAKLQNHANEATSLELHHPLSDSTSSEDDLRRIETELDYCARSKRLAVSPTD